MPFDPTSDLSAMFADFGVSVVAGAESATAIKEEGDMIRTDESGQQYLAHPTWLTMPATKLPSLTRGASMTVNGVSGYKCRDFGLGVRPGEDGADGNVRWVEIAR